MIRREVYEQWEGRLRAGGCSPTNEWTQGTSYAWVALPVGAASAEEGRGVRFFLPGGASFFVNFYAAYRARAISDWRDPPLPSRETTRGDIS